MSELKQRALDKMNEEMNQEHSSTEDFIHNWLCDQEDEELFINILREGKSIKNAMNYLIQSAKNGSKGSNVAVMSDAEGFAIIVDYFKGNETTIKSVGKVKQSSNAGNEDDDDEVEDGNNQEPEFLRTKATLPVKQTSKKQTKSEDSPLMSIFDFGVDSSSSKEQIDVNEVKDDANE